MSDYRKKTYPADQKGIALVAALLVSAILMVMVITMSMSLGSYLRSVGTSRVKTQTYYATVAATELARASLMDLNCLPPTWCGQLGNVLDTTSPKYRDLTSLIPGTAEFNGQTYRFFMKDNEDDADFTLDQDTLVMAVVTAQSPGQAGTETTIEAMLLYDQNVACGSRENGCGGYRQGGQDAKKSNRSNERISELNLNKGTLGI